MVLNSKPNIHLKPIKRIICKVVKATGGEIYMALPEPIPTIRKRDTPEFDERWKKFKLSVSQKKLYEGCEDLYLSNPF